MCGGGAWPPDPRISAWHRVSPEIIIPIYRRSQNPERLQIPKQSTEKPEVGRGEHPAATRLKCHCGESGRATHTLGERDSRAKKSRCDGNRQDRRNTTETARVKTARGPRCRKHPLSDGIKSVATIHCVQENRSEELVSPGPRHMEGCEQTRGREARTCVWERGGAT